MMKIKQAKTEDIERLADMLLRVSVSAHDFIPETYWQSNYVAMKDKYLPAVDNYIAEDKYSGELIGFISLTNAHIEALFVDADCQGKGVGQTLLAHAKQLHPVLSLAVYERNSRAVDFYLAVASKYPKGETTKIPANRNLL